MDPMTDEQLAALEAEHQPEPRWPGGSNCAGDHGHDHDGLTTQVDWPCDVAQLVAEVRGLQAALKMLLGALGQG